MNFRKIYLLLCIAAFSLLSCGKEPVFTEMSTNRLKIVIKGTFETDSKSFFESMPSDANDSKIQDDSVVSAVSAANGSVDAPPTVFMLDIAEIRLGGKKISNYRQVFSIPLDDTQPFFNGTGIELTTDDPGDGNYDTVQLFIRKMIFDNAKVYQFVGNTPTYEKLWDVIFHEDTIHGFDFNQLMVNSYWDSLRLEANDTVRVFPVQIPIIGGMKYLRENGETVLEIRLVIKNFIKKYEADVSEDFIYKVLHYYAFSDWLRDVRTGETDIGRNLHAVARTYVPGKTGSITVANASGGYVVAIPENEPLSDYYITSVGKTLRDNVKGDFPMPPSYPGAYIEPLLDYFLKYENYKNAWNIKLKDLESATVDGCSDNICKYEHYWDIYETEVKGFAFGLKIPPYVAYGSSVTFINMAPGVYKFYRLPVPAYGELFLPGNFTPLNSGTAVTINEGANPGI